MPLLSRGPVPNPSVFYFYTRNATFIQKDLVMLRKEFHVLEHSFPAPEKWKTPLLFLSQLGFVLQHLGKIRSAVFMCQFAGYHSFLPCLLARLLGRPSIIVVGGTDCVAFPSLRYGHFQNKLLAWFTKASYRWVHTVSAVHESLFGRDNPYAGEAERKQGILHFFPKARFRRNAIPNGFDTDLFKLGTPWEERPVFSFISISASLNDPIRMRLKGIDLVLELARRLPEAHFTLVGAEGKLDVPENVRLLPYVPNEQLPALYNQHRYYMQLSLSEGFPNALSEAMACGCIPMVSAVASMPEIVGSAGLILPERNADLLETLVRQRLLKSEGEEAQVAATSAQSIARRFNWARRETELRELVRSLGASDF